MGTEFLSKVITRRSVMVSAGFGVAFIGARMLESVPEDRDQELATLDKEMPPKSKDELQSSGSVMLRTVVSDLNHRFSQVDTPFEGYNNPEYQISKVVFDYHAEREDSISDIHQRSARRELFYKAVMLIGGGSAGAGALMLDDLKSNGEQPIERPISMTQQGA